MSRKVKFIGLSQQLTDLLIKHNLKTCKDLLNKSELELMLLLRISIQSANEIINKASKAISPKPTNALEMSRQFMFQKQCWRSTWSALGDQFFGGVRSGLITEIAGPPGCGKTQFCLMLAVIFITSDETGCKSVLYIDTEGAFDANRLIEIAHHKYPIKYSNSKNLQSLAERIVVCRERHFQDLSLRLENLEEEIITKKAGLVIIDSIASPIRREFGTSHMRNIYERNKVLSEHASLLKFLASEYNFPVILTNQITTQFSENDVNVLKTSDMIHQEDLSDGETDEASSEGGGNVVVALGVHWSHCVHTRIILQYSSSANDREMHLVKSPYAPYVKLYYTVDSTGISFKGEGEFSSRNNFIANVNTKSGLPL